MVIVIAAIAMVIQDILATLLVQAESRNRSVLAGGLDALMWIAGITTTYNALDALHSPSLWHKVLTIAVMSVANVGGTMTGTVIGKRFIKEAK